MRRRMPSHRSARGWPAWLALLALSLQLLAPGLCLAQRLASAPLGALCSVEPGRAPASLPGDELATTHVLEHCHQCVPGSAPLGGDDGWRRAEPPAPATATRLRAALPPPASGGAWRPPPRAPPGRA